MRVEANGFTALRRADFIVTDGSTYSFDFELETVSPIIDFEIVDNRKYAQNPVDESDLLHGKYVYESLNAPPSGQLRPLIMFGGRGSQGGEIRYTGAVIDGAFRPAVLTYDHYTLRANVIVYDRVGNSFAAIGEVVWEDGKTIEHGKRLRINLGGPNPTPQWQN